LSLRDQLKLAFDLATLRLEARSIKAPHQWHRATELINRCRAARTREEALYEARYDARVEMRRRDLVAKAGTIHRELKPGWSAPDRFSPDITLRQAQRDVRHAHAARIDRIDLIEHRGLDAICVQSRRENALRGKAVNDFEKAVDRRVGTDRRRPRQRAR
jgi:hypothetical protein